MTGAAKRLMKFRGNVARVAGAGMSLTSTQTGTVIGDCRELRSDNRLDPRPLRRSRTESRFEDDYRSGMFHAHRTDVNLKTIDIYEFAARGSSCAVELRCHDLIGGSNSHDSKSDFENCYERHPYSLSCRTHGDRTVLSSMAVITSGAP